MICGVSLFKNTGRPVRYVAWAARGGLLSIDVYSIEISILVGVTVDKFDPIAVDA